MRRLFLSLAVLLCALATAVAPAAGTARFPESIPLPDGFYPEGIAVGRGHDFYVGSLLDGALVKGDLRTGESSVLAPGVEGRLLVGLSFDRRSGLVWAAGTDSTGAKLFAFDGRTGALVHEVAVPDGAFLNDLAITRDAIHVTDSLADVFWTVPLTRRGAPAGPPVAVPLSGDFTFVTEGELPINLNGIVATPNGKVLIAVHTSLGALYRIHPATGVATEITLDEPVPFGDGIVLHGRTLYVVQNFLNQVAVVDLAPDLSSGRVVDTITSDLFRVPTTAARFGDSLYLVNARFDAAFPPALGGEPASLDYDVVRVRLR
jgi:sugar lactone lactonase YvrE